MIASVAAVILLPSWNRRGVEAVLERAEKAEVTYPEQGETLSDELPSGYQHDRRDLHLGHGDRPGGVPGRPSEAGRLTDSPGSP